MIVGRCCTHYRRHLYLYQVRIRNMSSPTGVKSKPNLRQGLPHWGMVYQNLRHDLPHRGMTTWTQKSSLQLLQKSKLNPVCLIAYLAKMQTESRTRLCIPCKIMNRIEDKVLHTLPFYPLTAGTILPPLHFHARDLGQGFAALAKLWTESQAYNSNLGMASPDFLQEKPIWTHSLERCV